MKHKIKKQELFHIGKNFGIQLRDVEKIILKKTELSRENFFLLDEISISDTSLDELKTLFRKMSFGYPIEYILESAEFYGLSFYVDNRCLIPRNDTEIMVEQAIKEIIDYTNKSGKVLYIDVGTGSGAIPISIVDNIGDNIDKAYAVDISEDALEIAQINIKKHQLVDKIELLKSDLLADLSPFIIKEGVMGWVITANLPYIKNEDYGNIDKEVILHEPEIALYGGDKTGFELYEKLINQIIKIKKCNSKRIVLFIEIGFDQKTTAILYLKKLNLEYFIYKDNGGVERCIKIIF